jgi:integrase
MPMAGTIRKRTWVSRKGGQKTAWLVDYFDQQRKRHTKQFPTKKAADAWLLQARGEVRDGIHTPDSSSITIAEAADEWVERARLFGRTRSTVAKYEWAVRMHVKPLLGHVRLAQLTTPLVADYRDQLLRTRPRVAAQTAFKMLKMIVNEMQRRGKVAQNAALAVRFAAEEREKEALVPGRDIPTKEEVQRMLETVPARWYPWLLTAVFTGMRISELLGLAWDAVDFEQGVIAVRQRADPWLSLGPPKTKASRRQIPMAPSVARALREWRLVCPRTPDGRLWLVFPNNVGGVMNRFRLETHYYGPLQIQAGIVSPEGARKYGFHKLRHFFASWAIEQGFAPKRLQEIIGHSSIMMTYDVYGHWFPNPVDDQTRMAAGERAVLGAARA